MPEVHDATAIVVGELAIVGIDVNEKLDRSDVGTIKYTVAEALKSDPYGANAFVAADVDTVTRLQEMRAKIDAGYPVAGVMNELAGIVGRLMPVTPGSEHKKEDPQPTDANDERLSNHQKKELEDIQEEQGKRDMEIEDRPRRKQTEDNIPEQGTLKNVDELERSRD
ncbi:MAG: YhcN/YlaJ family sporulation lipoprotein [Bacillaceae bacterium]|nr:YhcN/YlaJ family sporulation lipoprotein [Bacillaceae bacterium]